ncbi:MAG: hypothetical protein IPK81_05840 [Rhodospirillales bacterium]|nr:MAG: hypothetical protein IPK81_05840 [Rhodospirillales bacterium]
MTASGVIAVAAAAVDITPDHAAPLAGFGRRVDWTRIDSPIEMNAVGFRDASGRRAVVVSADLLFVGPTLEAALVERAVARGLRRSDIFVAATHTHFAPSVDPTKSMLGRPSDAYIDFVAARGGRLIDEVTRDFAACHARRGGGGSRAGINRRRDWPLPYLRRHFALKPDGAGGWRLVGPSIRPTFGTAAMAPNQAGPSDPAITVWLLTDAAGAVVGVVWHFTCHPTGAPDPDAVTAEFPGIVRAALRARFGAGLPVVFLQGFAGDVRPRVPDRDAGVVHAFRRLVVGPKFAEFDRAGWERWAGALSDDVMRAVDDARSRAAAALSGTIASAAFDVELTALAPAAEAGRVVPFRRLRIGDALDLVGVGAEPLQGLAPMVSSAGITPVGYVGDAFGYWPPDSERPRGGYEVDGFMPLFGLPGRLAPGLDRVFRDAVGRLAAPD